MNFFQKTNLTYRFHLFILNFSARKWPARWVTVATVENYQIEFSFEVKVKSSESRDRSERD